VSGIQVTAGVIGQVTQVTLPFTGLSTTVLSLVLAALAGVGLVFLAMARRDEEEIPMKPWV